MASWRQVLAGVVVVGVAGAATPIAARAPHAGPQDKAAQAKADDAASQAQVQQMQALVRLTDTAMSGQPAPSDFPIQFANDFIRAQGSRVWIPITLTVDPAKLTNPSGEPLALYLRVAPRGMQTPPPPPPPAKDKDKKKKDAKASAPPPSPYAFEDVSFLQGAPAAAGQPIRIVRGVSVPAGSYDLYVALQERGVATPKTALLKQPLDVPNFASEFSTSSVILASETRQLATPVTPDQQSEHPYSFGNTEIVVSPDHAFRKSQELIVLLQIYNPTIPADKKFNLEATYTFYKQGPDGETRFNATEPQEFTPESMGAAFDPSAPDRSIQAGQGIPLQSFPEGAYRLEIKITDKAAGSAKVLTQSVNFTVTP